MKKSLLKKIRLSFFFILITNVSFGVINTAITSGTWETPGNWSLGHTPLATEAVVIAVGINITVNRSDSCVSLYINNSSSVTVNTPDSLFIGGDFGNQGTFTANAGSVVVFNGAVNSTLTGIGTYTIPGTVELNMASTALYLDVQSNAFIAGINVGGNYYFNFVRGTWKEDNSSTTLLDAYNSGSTNALTIPFGVVIEADAAAMHLCQNAPTGNAILSGKIFMNGGNMNIQLGQSLNSGQDFKYKVNGGTPQLYISSGTLLIGAGLSALTGSDYIDFRMTGGQMNLAQSGYSYGITFQLADVLGGKTFMSGGLITLQDACNANLPDIDMGGPNVAATLYSITGGTVQFGYTNTQGGSTYYGIDGQPTTNYPNFDFEAGVAKNASSFNGKSLNVLSLYVDANMTFDATGFPNLTILYNNGTLAFDDEGGFIESTNTVTFAGPVNQIINSASIGTENFYNLVIANAGAGVTTVGGTLNTVNVGGALTENSGVFTCGTMTTLNVTGNTTLNGGTFGTPPANVNESANWINNGGAFLATTGSVNFVGTTGQFIQGTAAAQTFYNVAADLTAGQLLTTGGSTNTVTTNNLTESTGNITAPATLNVNGNLTLTSGTFTSGANTFLGGNFINNSNGFVQGANTVTCNGTGAQTIGGSFPTIFNNLTINNTSATTIGVTQNLSTSVAGVFNLTHGTYFLNGDTLNITNSAHTAIIGGSATSYIVSENTAMNSVVNWEGAAGNAASYIFPFGDNISGTDYYLPFTFNITAAVAGNVALSTYHTGSNNTPFAPGVTEVNGNGSSCYPGSNESVQALVDRWWQITAPSSPTATITFTYAGPEAATMTGDPGCGTTLDAYHWNSVGWDPPVGNQTVAVTANGSTGSVKATGISIFSPWVLGLFAAPLPITLLSFDAVYSPDQNIVNLSWATASEINNKFFTVERSIDGINYTDIVNVNGAGNSTQILYYKAIDPNPVTGIDYYRLKQTDFDGNYTYSDVVPVTITAKQSLVVYPNPVRSNLVINYTATSTGPLFLKVIEAGSGRIIGTFTYNAIEGNNTFTVNADNYANGVYILQSTAADGSTNNSKFVKMSN